MVGALVGGAGEDLRRAREALRRVNGPLRGYPTAAIPPVAEAARRLVAAIEAMERLAVEHRGDA